MKQRFTEEQIIKAIKEHEAGVKVPDLCRRLNISTGTFYNWRSKYAGMEASEAKRLRELESENSKLIKLPAARKLVATCLMDSHRLSECRACQLSGISRTAFRYQPKEASDAPVRARLIELASRHKALGYPMLHGMLKSEGLVVNQKHTKC